MSQPRAERRRSPRRAILDSFSLFVVVPKKGVHRLKIHDLSAHGIGFDIDVEGESPEDFRVSPNESLELHFYLNQSLYLPLDVQVARIEQANGVRRVGAQFADQESPAYHGLASFMAMLDAIEKAARFGS